MKYLFFISGVLIAGIAAAQNDDTYYLEKQLKHKNAKKNVVLPQYRSPNPQTDIAYSLPNGNKVTSLQQDNMPCIVPDMSRFNMPCIKPEKQYYNMPVVPGNSLPPTDLAKKFLQKDRGGK
jgi:hypothetical protein